MNRLLKPYLRYVVIILFFALCILRGYSISDLPQSRLLWDNMDISHHSVTTFCIFKDNSGIMWFGTNDGLFFFEGVTTRRVSIDMLRGTQVYSIIQVDKSLLLGTNNGLMKYDYLTNELTWPYQNTPTEIRCLVPVDKRLWIGGLNGIVLLNMDNGEIIDYSDQLPHKSVYSILRDSRGIIYVGTYNGLSRFDAVEKSFRTVGALSIRNSIKNIFVNCLLESEDNSSIFIGTEGNLYKYNLANDKCEQIPQFEGSIIKCLSNSSTGLMLIGTDNGVYDLSEDGIRSYRHDSRYNNTIADNNIWCLESDSDGIIWAGHEKGVSISASSNTIRTLKLSDITNCGEGNDICVIGRDTKGNLWFGGTNGIIRLSNDNKSQWYRHSSSKNSLSHNRVRFFMEDYRGNVWLSTDMGINRYNDKTGGFDRFIVVDSIHKHYSNWVYAMAQDGNSFWIGSYLGGLYNITQDRFDLGGELIEASYAINTESGRYKDTTIKLRNDLVNNVIVDGRNNVWILLFRDQTLIKLSPNGKTQEYDVYELSGGYPTNICLDKNGEIWCAYGNGILHFKLDDTISNVKFPPLSDDNGIISLGCVNDKIWVSTQNNIWEIDIKEENINLLPIPQKPYTCIYYDEWMGKVLLGSADELTEVNPINLGNASENKSIKMVYINNAEGNLDMGINFAESGELTLSSGSSVSLVISNLDYTPESIHRYSYKLAKNPSDTVGNWIVMSEGGNTITLSDLSMGSYCLMVKTLNSPLSPLLIPIKVKAPWSLSFWAICIYIFIFCILIFCIIAYMRHHNAKVLIEEERKKSLESVERKLSFLSDISHDLKTPLSMIIGPVSVLKEKTDDPDCKKTLEVVYENAMRLNNMIHRTLELRHLDDDDEAMLIISTFDAVEFCKSVFETFEENNPNKKFVFHTSVPQILIDADAVKFESIVTNLMSNACKYSDPDATISCGISRIGDKIQIVVSDDGVGIADIDQPLIFQRMFRAPSTSKIKEGTGIGLYLIKKYLELMGGSIELFSKENQGTSFIVTLPMSKNQTIESNKCSENIDCTRPKILIVEDNKQISVFIADLLKHDYTCLTAENGRAGLSIASSFVPDLIIMDELMPVMKGLEMAQKLKQNPRLANIPTIMLTAKSDNNTENESVKRGVDIFMSKPFEPSVLLGRIKRLINARKELQASIRIQAITEAKPIEAESISEKQLSKIVKVIEDNISDSSLNVSYVCEKSGIPNKQLYRILKKYTGSSPLDYIRNVRLQKAAMLIAQHRFTVAEVAYMVGFKTPSYFSKCFLDKFGVLPSQYETDDQTGTAGH